MEHAVRTDLGLTPGLGTEQTGFADEGHGADEELVEVLDGYLGRIFLAQVDNYCVTADFGVAPQSSEEMTHAALGGTDAIFEAKALRVVGVARVRQVVQGLGSIPTIDYLPTLEQEHRDRIKGTPAPSRSPAQPLGQNGAKARKVNQAQDQVKVGKMGPGCQFQQVIPALIDVVRAVALLWRRGHVGRCAPGQRQSLLQAPKATLVNKV